MARLCGSNCRGFYERLFGELGYRYAISIFDSYFMCCGGSELKICTGVHKGITHPPTLSLGVRTGELEKNPGRRAKEMDILRRLDKSPYRDRKDRNPDRIPGTCEWFVAHKLFRDWQESESSRMLWVSADPGCGKSVLAKYLVDSVLATTESRTICYFFFKDDFEDQRSIVCALCCILRQLFLQKRMLLSEKIFEQFEMGGERFTSSFNEL